MSRYVMPPEEIKKRAAEAPKYYFGSDELKHLHSSNRGPDNLYTNLRPIEYVVRFSSCRGSPSFSVLNIIRYGQLTPESHDIPA